MATSLKTYYIVRVGWNAANQSAVGRPRNPQNQFESGHYKLVQIVEAADSESAKAACTATVYNGQYLFAESNPRGVAGLTSAIRMFSQSDCW